MKLRALVAVCAVLAILLAVGCARILPQRTVTYSDGSIETRIDYEAAAALAQIAAQMAEQAVENFRALNQELKLVDPERYERELAAKEADAKRRRDLADKATMALFEKMLGHPLPSGSESTESVSEPEPVSENVSTK